MGLNKSMVKNELNIIFMYNMEAFVTPDDSYFQRMCEINAFKCMT